jgi:hypothetical protein
MGTYILLEHIKITTISTPHRYSEGYTKQLRNTDEVRKDKGAMFPSKCIVM